MRRLAMIGRDLGEHFEAIPGRFAERPRFVLTYRAPDHQDVVELVQRLCVWLADEFHFPDGTQSFSDAVVQAIVTHVYTRHCEVTLSLRPSVHPTSRYIPL